MLYKQKKCAQTQKTQQKHQKNRFKALKNEKTLKRE